MGGCRDRRTSRSRARRTSPGCGETGGLHESAFVHAGGERVYRETTASPHVIHVHTGIRVRRGNELVFGRDEHVFPARARIHESTIHNRPQGRRSPIVHTPAARMAADCTSRTCARPPTHTRHEDRYCPVAQAHPGSGRTNDHHFQRDYATHRTETAVARLLLFHS